jgi:hypothetical protein
MPSETSLYYKILLTVEVAAGQQHVHASELESALLAKRGASFSTLQYDKKRDEFTSRPSPKTVHRTVRFCVRLGLIDSSGTLTAAGRRAAIRSKFDGVLTNQIFTAFEDAGAPADKIGRIIQRSLTQKPPEMPTAPVLWAALQPRLKRGEFGRLLTLLSHCGSAQAFQRRIYLSIGGR